MTVTDEFLDANKSYQEGFEGPLPLPPARKVAVVACMDARPRSRQDPRHHRGRRPRHPQRRRGRDRGRPRSLAISQRLLGTEEIVLVHHTDCGMVTFQDDAFRQGIEAETGIRPTWSSEAFPDAGGRRRAGHQPHQGQPVHPAQGPRPRLRLRRRDRRARRGLSAGAAPGTGQLPMRRSASAPARMVRGGEYSLAATSSSRRLPAVVRCCGPPPVGGGRDLRRLDDRRIRMLCLATAAPRASACRLAPSGRSRSLSRSGSCCSTSSSSREAARAHHEGVRDLPGRLRRPGDRLRHLGHGLPRRPRQGRRLRPAVLCRLADRVQPVDRQPVHLHHHHGQLQGAAEVPAGGAAGRHHHRPDLPRRSSSRSAPWPSSSSPGSSTSSARSCSTPAGPGQGHRPRRRRRERGRAVHPHAFNISDAVGRPQAVRPRERQARRSPRCSW